MVHGRPAALLAILTFTALPVADGSGEVRAPRNGQNVMVGPPGWLPDVLRFGVVGIRIENGALSTETVDEATFPDLPTQEQVRQLLARHYRIERWYSGHDDLQTRPGEMIAALGAGLLETPTCSANRSRPSTSCSTCRRNRTATSTTGASGPPASTAPCRSP